MEVLKPLNFMYIDLILIGCGGTGGCFFSRFARFMTDAAIPDVTIKIRIIDGDFVELKNINRQPFTEDDIGKNKAVSLALTAEESLGVHVKSYPLFLSPSTLHVLHDWPFDGPQHYHDNLKIMIGAVDNHACRKLLHEFFQSNYSDNLFYIDSANEFSCGEIVIGKRLCGKTITPDRAHYYPEILTDKEKAVYEMSCEELNQAKPQHIATNGLAADLIFSYVVQLILFASRAKEAPGGIIYFDSFKLFSRFDPYEETRHGKIK